MVEGTLEELNECCARCWTSCYTDYYRHDAESCPVAERVSAIRGNRISRGPVNFAVNSHSCFRCGLSQKLCRTGQDESAACQWPNVMRGFAAAFQDSGVGNRILEELGVSFDGEEEEQEKEYWR